MTGVLHGVFASSSHATTLETVPRGARADGCYCLPSEKPNMANGAGKSDLAATNGTFSTSYVLTVSISVEHRYRLHARSTKNQTKNKKPLSLVRPRGLVGRAQCTLHDTKDLGASPFHPPGKADGFAQSCHTCY